MVNSVQLHNTGRATFDSVCWKTVDEANNFLSDYFTTGYHPVRLDNKTTVRALNKKTRNREFTYVIWSNLVILYTTLICEHGFVPG